jgi:hypothetical protein
MNIFGPVVDPDTVTVTRSSPLEDVFSAAFHSAPSYAEAHCVAFHVSPTFGAAARSRLTKRESVRLRCRRMRSEWYASCVVLVKLCIRFLFYSTDCADRDGKGLLIIFLPAFLAVACARVICFQQP